uniref:Wsv037-like protein n=1 Tax=Hemigrapsus takanoi nimavirus TaxID=2133792 RepID=A0A401IP27_9VIRU|nr:MAG: wsv037-like protein [Hemigrapsus takanoi nimavirus]GBG35373.1 wsv037-like protein [Hemigrapsus takanoi nimavirus]
MEIFLTNSHRGASLLSSYRNQPPPPSRRKKIVARVEDTTGVPTRADFTKSVQGVASPFFLVSPDAPSDRERLVYVNSIYESILNYRDMVFSAEAPVWCPFNSPSLHRHIMKERLERAGLVNSSRFVCNPVEGAGEMTAFKYTSTTPQHLVFPVGSEKINWLTALRGSSRTGKAFARSSKLSNGPIGKEDGRLGALELKRFRIWRAFDWIGECCRRGGMLRYEPFSVGTALYDAEAVRLNPKSAYERSLLYLGDHFARETVLLSDICQGGKYNSDFWAITDAVYRYGQKHERIKKKDSIHNRDSEEDWVTALEDISDLNDNGPHDDFGRLEDAILEYDAVGAEKRRRMLDFAHSVLSNAQRDSVYDAFSHLNEGTAAAFVDACVVSPARSGVYLMLYSLLKIVNFDILNIIGYEAHRILVFKLFVPALLGVFLSNGGLGDVFENGSFMLELFSKKAGKETIRSVLERSSMAASETRRSKNYAKNDTATLYGELIESTAKLPLAINLAVHAKSNERAKELLNTFNEGIIKVSIAKEKLSEKQRHARRVLKRRKKVKEENEGCNSSSSEEEEEEEEGEEGVLCSEEEKESSDEETGGEDKKESSTKKSNRRHLVAGRLKKNKRLLPPGLCLSTITNNKREINVEDIQKMLSARQTKRKNLQQILEDCKNGKATKKSIDDNAVRCYLLALMNIFDSVFGLERGSLMNSIHTNASDVCLTKAENDSILAENNEAKVGVIKPSASDSEAKRRLAELIMDPPSLVGITDHTIVERTLQNEQMLRSLVSNPVFTSILNAEHGDVGRYVVLSNIVKFMSVALSCLVDGDMPLLEDTRKNVKTALDRGKAKHVKKSGNAYGKSSNSQLDSYDYRDAGSYPSGASDLREQLLPPCITQLKSIAVVTGRGGRVSMSKQTCEHAFCRMLKFLYYSLDPSAPGKDSRYANFFVDSASVATLYQTVEADKKDLYNNLVRRVMAGSESWLTDRDYTSIDREDDALSPVDFFSVLKVAIINEGIVMSPKPGSGDSRKVPDSGDDIYEESMAVKCEAFRARMFKKSELLPDAPFVRRTPEELAASLKRKKKDCYAPLNNNNKKQKTSEKERVEGGDGDLLERIVRQSIIDGGENSNKEEGGEEQNSGRGNSNSVVFSASIESDPSASAILKDLVSGSAVHG